MAEFQITHTWTDGTFAVGGRKGDGTYELMRTAGFDWHRQLGCYYIRDSARRGPDEPKIEAAKLLLGRSGHTVRVALHRSEGTAAPAAAPTGSVTPAGAKPPAARRGASARVGELTLLDRLDALEALRAATADAVGELVAATLTAMFPGAALVELRPAGDDEDNVALGPVLDAAGCEICDLSSQRRLPDLPPHLAVHWAGRDYRDAWVVQGALQSARAAGLALKELEHGPDEPCGGAWRPYLALAIAS